MIYRRKTHKLIFTIFLFYVILIYTGTVMAGAVSLTWSPPAENADGTILDDLAGYTIYYGSDSGIYNESIDVGNVTAYEVQGLTSGLMYYFAVTAYDFNGNESDYSVEANILIESTAPVTYYCDNDNDGSINSQADGVCNGAGCVPSGCSTSPGNDCDDSNSVVYPGASDTTCNGIDENCDGTPDNNYVAPNSICGTGACQSAGQLICSNGSIVDTCSPGPPSGDDSDCNNIDDDCDGIIDNNYVTKTSTCGTGVCSSIGQVTCNNGSISNSCTPWLPQEPVETSLEDGLDNDCDGLVDEGKTAKINVDRVIIAEDFTDGIPDFWTTEGSWSTDNACGQSINEPFAGAYAITDSSCQASSRSTLTTSPFDTSGCDTLRLSFANQYYWYAGSMEVDVSTDGGQTWSNYIFSENNEDYPVPGWKYIDLDPVSESEKTLVNFKYVNEDTSGFWAIDNVWIACNMSGLSFSSHINLSSPPESVRISNSSSDTLSIHETVIDGADASDFNTDFTDCTDKALQPGESCMIDIVFTPSSEGQKNASLHIKTYDPSNQGATVLLTGTAKEAIPPLPSITVNGLDEPVSVVRGTEVTVTVDLDPKSYAEKNGDWWILMEHNNRWYYFSYQSAKWRRGNMLYQQGPFSWAGSVDVLRTANLRKGTYTFYFGVDTQMNGLQDLSHYYSDHIVLTVK